ncbi:hypothetical protein COLO4_24266 [Corchorus olitorius]|uniref:Uncharacterized protein n=1 Tax=Corchorus olitorius TaxID=93759 RepID=A0A1R3IBW7_9ROSI|nr:hypothetical protein COLO4_24266 [Corchorus olitorius]
MIPRQWNGLEELTTMDLSKNILSGSIPTSLCSLGMFNGLKLNANNLSVELSTFLGRCKVWFALDLRENGFSGTIPQSIVAYPDQVYLLNLRTNLHILDLGHNNLSGPIPTCLGRILRLRYLQRYFFQSQPTIRDSFFSEHTELVIKGKKTEFSKIITLVRTIDLSDNNLVGEILILEEITNLSFLGSLNLSWNQLTGKIPENIGSLQRLEALDLSHNHLSGPIPPSIYIFNNSVEPFELVIQQPVWAIQDSAGNNCSSSANGNGVSKDKGTDEDESSRTLWIYISATLGFVVGFWAVFGTLMIKKSIRHAYFKSLDDIADKIAVLITVNVARLKRKIGFERIQTQL